MKPTYIVEDLDAADLLKDPIRRQILDLLGEEEMTEAEMAKKLEFSAASINYHLKELSRKGLVHVARTEVESHGIVQKFYLASARLIMVDYEKMPYSVKRYTLALYKERVRGALAAIRLRNRTMRLDRDVVEGLSDALAREVVAVARRVKESPAGQTREEMILKIYSTALSRVAGTAQGRPLREAIPMAEVGLD